MVSMVNAKYGKCSKCGSVVSVVSLEVRPSDRHHYLLYTYCTLLTLPYLSMVTYRTILRTPTYALYNHSTHLVDGHHCHHLLD